MKKLPHQGLRGCLRSDSKDATNLDEVLTASDQLSALSGQARAYADKRDSERRLAVSRRTGVSDTKESVERRIIAIKAKMKDVKRRLRKRRMKKDRTSKL